MDKEIKLLFGKLIGEIYRLQKNSDKVSCPAESVHIYGLINGFEHSIEEEIERIGFVSEDDFSTVVNILDEIWVDDKKRKDFKGYYDIEHKLKSHNIQRWTAKAILKYLKANYQFIELIEKMDSKDSPIECKTFDLNEFDK